MKYLDVFGNEINRKDIVRVQMTDSSDDSRIRIGMKGRVVSLENFSSCVLVDIPEIDTTERFILYIWQLTKVDCYKNEKVENVPERI